MSVGFRPTEEDLRIIEASRRQDEKTSDEHSLSRYFGLLR
jgi:hypothetical protein